MLYSISEAQILALEDYVANGGTIIGTYMMGYANETDLCYLGGFPGGKLKDIFGLVATEIDSLYPSDTNSVSYNGTSHKCTDYAEIIIPTTANESIAKAMEKGGIAEKRGIYSPNLMKTQISAIDDLLMGMEYFGE